MFEVPRNEDTADVLFVFEISSDLVDWSKISIRGMGRAGDGKTREEGRSGHSLRKSSGQGPVETCNESASTIPNSCRSCRIFRCSG